MLDIQKVTKNYIAPKYDQAPFVSFSGKELIEKENKKLAVPLQTGEYSYTSWRAPSSALGFFIIVGSTLMCRMIKLSACSI